MNLLRATRTTLQRATRRPPRSVFALAGRVAPRATARFVADQFLRPPRSAPSTDAERAFATRLRPVEIDPDVFVAELGDGPPVLLVHGWGFRGTRLHALAEAVVASGRRAVLLDLPGHGRSAGHHLSPPAAATTLLRVGQVLGPFEAVIGHSFGGAVAGTASARGLPTSRLVMIGSPSAYARVFDRVLDDLGIEGPVRGHAFDALEAKVGVPVRSVDVARTAQDAGDRALLIVHDPEDREVPFDEALRNARLWPNAELLRVEGAGHRRILGRADVQEAVLAFIDR